MGNKSQIAGITRTADVNAEGFGVFGNYVCFDPDLTLEAKAIYGYLCAHAGSGNTAYPAVKTVLHHLNIGKNRFYRHFNLLAENGYITVKKVRTPGSKFLH
jgi:hypothetical protein